VKSEDFISVGYVNVIVMENDSKRQVQMIGKDFARLGNGLFTAACNTIAFPAAESATKMSSLCATVIQRGSSTPGQKRKL
jgi:hypothetical protein